MDVTKKGVSPCQPLFFTGALEKQALHTVAPHNRSLACSRIRCLGQIVAARKKPLARNWQATGSPAPPMVLIRQYRRRIGSSQLGEVAVCFGYECAIFQT